MTANLTAADENDMPSRILGMLSQPWSSVQAIFPTLSLTVLLPHPNNIPRRNIITEFNSETLLSVQCLVVTLATVVASMWKSFSQGVFPLCLSPGGVTSLVVGGHIALVSSLYQRHSVQLHSFDSWWLASRVFKRRMHSYLFAVA